MQRSIWLSFFYLLVNCALASDLQITKPESVGMSSERLERVTQPLQTQVNEGQMAGAVAMVARQGKVVFVTTVGKQNLETGVPKARDTLFRIYAMPKPITAVAAMNLYDEGVFKLSDPL